MNIIVKTLRILWYIMVWFASLVEVDMAYQYAGLKGVAFLLAAYWSFYLIGLYLEKPSISNAAWTMLLGFAIGMFRLFDIMYPNQEAITSWLHHVPREIIGAAGLAFIFIFVCLLPAIAKNIVASHKAQNRVLGRDY